MYEKTAETNEVYTQITKFMGPTWGPPGSCRPQMGPCWPYEPCYQGILSVVEPIINVINLLIMAHLTEKLWGFFCELRYDQWCTL